MTLEELLETTAKEFLDDRSELLDGDNDDLWSDALLVKFLNEGQRLLCRSAWVLVDTGNAKAGIITLVEGKTTYPLHKSVLRVIHATVSGEEAALTRYHEAAFTDPPSQYLEDFDIDRASVSTPGAPTAIATDAGTRKLRVYPPPAAAQTGTQLLLKVARMPVCLLSLDTPTESPEVPEEYHLALCEYAAGRCLTLPNVSSAGKADGKLMLASFKQVVSDARRDRQRADRAPARFRYASTTARL